MYIYIYVYLQYDIPQLGHGQMNFRGDQVTACLIAVGERPMAVLVHLGLGLVDGRFD